MTAPLYNKHNKLQSAQYVAYFTIQFIQRVCVVMGILLCGVSDLAGQVVLQPKPVEDGKGFVYNRETVYEIRPHFHGFSLAYKRGQIKSYYLTNYSAFEVGFYKDPREDRRDGFNTIIDGVSPSSYLYGKQNHFFVMRYNLGAKRLLSEKYKRRGVAMGLVYEGGLSLGLLKPYFLDVVDFVDDSNELAINTIRYDEEVHDQFLDITRIYGSAGMWKGITDITPTVGLHAKIGLHWALKAFEQRVQAIEAGLMLDVYPREIPIMVETGGVRNSFFFAKFYASFQFGKRRI